MLVVKIFISPLLYINWLTNLMNGIKVFLFLKTVPLAFIHITEGVSFCVLAKKSLGTSTLPSL